jgi:hypothetical protein
MTKLGYKKCQPIKNQSVRLIGIFEIFEDSIIAPKLINEFSKARVNKCKLISVEDLKGDPVELQEIEPVRFLETDPYFIFKMNEIIETNIFDDSENYIGHGIVMFFNKIRAQNYLIENLNNGTMKTWRDTGILYAEENYQNYKKHGICKYYHSNGNIKELAEYNFDYLVNIQKIYDIDGKLIKTVDRTIKYNYNDNYKT